jgi:4'-phosphopantetheinyl transferase
LTDLDDLPLDAGPTGLTRREGVIKRRIQQRFVLRLLLGSYLGVPGKSVQVRRNRFDKPDLAGELAHSGLKFNVSHSGRWLAIALTRGSDIGVDIEQHRTLPRAADLAQRFLSGPDVESIVALEEPERSPCFLRQWTAREALIKAMGHGIAGSIGQLVLGCNPLRIHQLPSDWPRDWQLLAPEWPSDLTGHVAVPGDRAVDLVCYWLQTARRDAFS